MKDITRFNRTQMKILATYVKGRIIEDMNNGIFQNDKRDLQYKSESYTTYKANGMNKLNGSGRLKGFSGSTDREVSRVNMILSGRTKDGMREGSRKNVAYITYDQGHIVQGNKDRHGYAIIGLRPKNLDLTAKYMAQHLLSKNARRELAKVKDWK